MTSNRSIGIVTAVSKMLHYAPLHTGFQRFGLLSLSLCAGGLSISLPLPAVAQQADEDIILPDTTIIVDGFEPQPTAEQLDTIPGLTPLQRNVAETLEELCATTTSANLQSSCGILRAMTDDEAHDALQEIAPAQLPALGTTAVIITNAQVSTISTRMQALRSGAYGKTMDKFLVSVNDDVLITGATGGGAGDNSIVQRLGLFLTGQAYVGDKDTTERELGFDFDSQGVTAGMDYRLTDSTIIGGALGYAMVEADFHDSAGDQETTALMVSAYGTHYTSAIMYVDWIASYSDNDYDTTRNLPTFNTETTSNTDGNQWALSLNAGAEINRGAWLLNPYVRLEYIDADIDGYVEKGGAGLAIQYDDQSQESLTSTLGGRISRAVSTSWAVLVPSLYGEWVHEFQDDARRIQSRFSEDPGTVFSIQTDDPDRDFFKFGMSAAATFARGRAAYISYETYVDLDDVNYYQLDIGLRLTF